MELNYLINPLDWRLVPDFLSGRFIGRVLGFIFFFCCSKHHICIYLIVRTTYTILTYHDSTLRPRRSFPLSDDVWMSLVGALARGPRVNTALPPPTTPLIKNLPTVTVLSEECPYTMILHDLMRKWFLRRYSDNTVARYLDMEAINIPSNIC